MDEFFDEPSKQIKVFEDRHELLTELLAEGEARRTQLGQKKKQV